MYIYTLGLLSMRQDPSMSMSCCEVSAVSPGVTSILVVRHECHSLAKCCVVDMCLFVILSLSLLLYMYVLARLVSD